MIVQPVPKQPTAASRLIACLLAFSAVLLALTSGLAWAYLDNPPEADGSTTRQTPVLATASVTLVEHFFEAVNVVIATGDDSPLTELVDPGFAEHPARTGVTPGRDGLVQSLLAMRATAPELRIVLDSAAASAAGDEVTVRLHTTGSEDGAFLGLPLPTELNGWGWGPLEVLRVTNGKIAERWSGQEPAALLQPLAVIDELPGGIPSTLDVVALLRLTIAPETDIQFTTGLQARVLFAETGTLSITTDDGTASPGADFLGSERVLEAGGIALAPPQAEIEVVNDGSVPASLVVVARYAMAFGPSTQEGIFGPVLDEASALVSVLPGAVTAQVLTIGVIPPGTQVTIALGRVTVRPGSTLTWQAGPTLLLALDTGSLVLATDDVGMEGIRAGGERWFDDDAVLEPGDGASIPAESSSIWRNQSSTPAVLLVLTLTVS